MPKAFESAEIPNTLLARLPQHLFEKLTENGDIVRLEMRRVLHEADAPAPHVYFPLSGVISLLTVLDDSSAVEIATVGSEGMVDFAAYLDLESPARWLVQVPGYAYRVDAARLRDLSRGAAELQAVMHDYMLAMFVLVSQTAACNRRHLIEQRCARWLLMTHDRVDGDVFPMTHEFLADMLGVRRPSVSIAMNVLSRAGHIKYRRGRIEVLDRRGLLQATCECYGVLCTQFEKRFPAGATPSADVR